MAMVKIKVAEAAPEVLNWLVAELEVEEGGLVHALVYGRGSVRAHGYCHETTSGRRYFYVLPHTHKHWVDRCESYPFSVGTSVWSPSTNWSQGGPIIEREMHQNGFDLWCGVHTTDGRFAATYTRGVPECYVYGPTPLIAAMRCYVASKLGDEVEVPEELLT